MGRLPCATLRFLVCKTQLTLPCLAGAEGVKPCKDCKMFEDCISEGHIDAKNRYVSTYPDSYRLIVTQSNLSILR